MMKTSVWRGRSCGWRAAVAGVVMGMAGTANMAFADPGPTLSVSPTNMAWTSNTWVTLTVSNLPAGAAVNLGLFVDVQGNGVVDATDPLIAAYLVQDGRTNALGSSVIVDDEDGVANGTLVSRVSYFGQAGANHLVGNYLWLAKTVSGGTSTVARFAVTQPTSTVWLTGSVIDYVTSNAVPGAVAKCQCFSGAAMPWVWTDTNGAFRLYLPNGVSTSDVEEISAIGLGYFNPSTGPDGTTPISTYVFTNDLRLGANPLPITLRVVPAIPGAIHEVSGHVYAPGLTPVPGVLVNIEWGEDDEMVVGLTDTNGGYRLCVPDIENADLYPDPASLAGLGLVAVGRGLVVTQDMANVDLVCPAATLLARGRVSTTGDGQSVVGATVFLEGDMFGAVGVSLADGIYEVAVTAFTNYSARVDELPEGFMYPPDVAGVSITNNTVTNLDFRVERCFPVSGVVYDAQTNRVSGGSVGAFRYSNARKFWEWEVNTSLNRCGAYRLLAPTGQLVVVVADVPGCIGVVYSHYEYGDWDNNHVADLVPNTPAGTNGIDFYLEQCGAISGSVFEDDGMTPIEGCRVRVETLDGDSVNDSETDENGSFEVTVASGEYRVLAEGSQAPYGVNMYYDGWFQNQRDQANVVTAFMGQVTSNINFVMIPGGTLSGRVTEEDGSTPVRECAVEAQRDGAGMGTGRTDDDGYYSFRVPPGAYAVAARPDWDGMPYARQYFSNAVSQAEALELNVVTGGELANIDFRLTQGGTISGWVYDEDTSAAIGDCHVWAADFDSGEWMGGASSGNDGSYTLRLPAGRYRVEAEPQESGFPYIDEWYLDALDSSEAAEVTVTDAADTPDIDFALSGGGTISGHIYREGDLSPLANCHVYAEDFASGEWMNGVNTESDGSYTLRLPAGNYRVRAYPENNGLPYLNEWYSNTLDRSDAEAVTVTDAANTPGIDFVLGQPCYIRGRVTDRNTGLPIAGIGVYAASIPNTNEFWNNWVYFGGPPSDNNGNYSVAVSPGSNYIVETDSGNTCYMKRSWSNQTDRTQATLLTIAAATTVSNIDFALIAGGRITGHISRDDGGTSLGDCDVYALDYMTDQWVDGKRTDSSGYYSMAAPAGMAYRVRAAPSNNGLPYVDEWFDDTTNWGSAQAVSVTLTNETGGIDFSLMVGDLNRDAWNGHYFTTSELGDPDIGGDDADPDHDGADNLEEYAADTDPRGSNSVLRVTNHGPDGGGLKINWQGGRWARQYLQRSDTLHAADGDWTNLLNNESLPTVVSNFFSDYDGVPGPCFYRIKVERDPAPR